MRRETDATAPLTFGLTEAERENRRTFIGGSDAGSIVVGGDAWAELRRQKTGRGEPIDLYDLIVNDPATNRFLLKYLTRERLELSALMGHATEPLNCYWYERQTGRAVEDRRIQIRNPAIPYLGCTLDGRTTTATGHPASFQTKHLASSGEAMEIRYTAQCHHEALVHGYDYYVLSEIGRAHV